MTSAAVAPPMFTTKPACFAGDLRTSDRITLHSGILMSFLPRSNLRDALNRGASRWQIERLFFGSLGASSAMRSLMALAPPAQGVNLLRSRWNRLQPSWSIGIPIPPVQQSDGLYRPVDSGTSHPKQHRAARRHRRHVHDSRPAYASGNTCSEFEASASLRFKRVMRHFRIRRACQGTVPSRAILIDAIFDPIFITTPRNPASATRRLLLHPMVKSAMPSSLQKRTIFATDSTESGRYVHHGPPTRNVGVRAHGLPHEHVNSTQRDPNALFIDISHDIGL